MLNYSWKASPNRWGCLELNATFSIGFGNGLFCPAYSTVLETTASNHTNAISRMFQSTAAGPASNSVTSPALIGGGRWQRQFFRGARQIPPQGPAAVQGRQRQRRQGLDGVGVGVIRHQIPHNNITLVSVDRS